MRMGTFEKIFTPDHIGLIVQTVAMLAHLSQLNHFPFGAKVEHSTKQSK